MSDRAVGGDADRLAGWVAAYDAQGWHRTGSRTDGRSARWLTGIARAGGATVAVETHAFDRVVHRRSALRLDGRLVPGVPLFDANLPPAGGVRGTLGPAGSHAEIAVVESTPGLRNGDHLDEVRRAGSHRAIVAITRGAAAGLALRNAPHAEPFGPPVLQISSRHADSVVRAAAARAVATIEATARRVPARLMNVVVETKDRRPGPPDVVVLTPRSGWWQCAAERGGGLACWLGTLHATRRSIRQPVRFLATSGHELGHLGLRAHLASQEAVPRGTWVHLGANLGARDGLLGVAASDEALAERAVGALRAAGLSPETLRPLPVVAGEALELQRIGARFVSYIGTSGHFHLPSDRYPANVDPQRLVATYRGVASLVTQLAD